MRPAQGDLNGAAFTLELLDVMTGEERLQTLATAFATQRRLHREQTLAAIEHWARDEKARAAELRRVAAPHEDYQHGMAQGMEIALIGLRRVIRELRMA